MIYRTPTPEELAKAQRLCDEQYTRIKAEPIGVWLREQLFGAKLAAELLEKVERTTN